MGRVYRFFEAHPKRQRALETAIATTQPESSVHKLKDLCRTRWVQRIDSLNIFCSLFESVHHCFETICCDGSTLWSSDSLTDARTLQLSIATTEFLSALVITKSCLSNLQGLTSSLQSETKDIVTAVREVDIVTATLRNIRGSIDSHHCKWWSAIEGMCKIVSTTPVLPRRCGRQMHRDNVPAETPSEYYRRTISIPMLDHFIAEMETRFSTHQQTALRGLSLVPSVMLSTPKTPEEYCSDLGPLAEMYAQDLPSPECLTSELHCWLVKWQRHESNHGRSSLPKSLSSALKQTSALFPNIAVLLRIMCTLPVTSCSAERSFSTLKRLKTPLRSTMRTDRLTNLSLLTVHRDITIDISEAVDEFCRRYPRRMELANILSD